MESDRGFGDAIGVGLGDLPDEVDRVAHLLFTSLDVDHRCIDSAVPHACSHGLIAHFMLDTGASFISVRLVWATSGHKTR